MARPLFIQNNPEWRKKWDQPWRVNPNRASSRRFKTALLKHGYLSPHYSLEEAYQNDGTPLPRRKRRKAQRHAFYLEQLRHKLGDKPIPVLSWWRSRAYNRSIGGATFSKHIKAIASDIDKSVVDRFGTSRFDAAANEVFAESGFGQYPAGSRHVDSRWGRARWTSY